MARRLPRIVLVGGGHAHLFVLEGLARGRFPKSRPVLLVPDRTQVYSGMVPGLIGGRYRAEELQFDMAALARSAGAQLIVGRALRVEPVGQRIHLAEGGIVEYDVASFAVGAGVAGGDLPGVRERALFVKPIACALEIVPELERLAEEVGGRRPVRAAVVGSGAAGVEVALALRARLRLLSHDDAIVELIGGDDRVLSERLVAATRAALDALRGNSVRVRLGAEVREVGDRSLRLSDGAELAADIVVWATGPSALDLFRGSGLTTDHSGFLVVDDRLRSVSHPAVFGAGDAVTLRSHPDTPRAGVYAVRAGPVLRDNLAAAVSEWPEVSDGRQSGVRYRSYRPQRRFLALLNTGDGRALLTYGSLALTARWAMRLKDRIDRRFMRRFVAL